MKNDKTISTYNVLLETSNMKDISFGIAVLIEVRFRSYMKLKFRNPLQFDLPSGQTENDVNFRFKIESLPFYRYSRQFRRFPKKKYLGAIAPKSIITELEHV